MFQTCHAFTSRAKVSEIDRDHARGLLVTVLLLGTSWTTRQPVCLAIVVPLLGPDRMASARRHRNWEEACEDLWEVSLGRLVSRLFDTVVSLPHPPCSP
jgi:hypothetical protein